MGTPETKRMPPHAVFAAEKPCFERVPSWEGARERQAKRISNRNHRRASGAGCLPPLNLKGPVDKVRRRSPADPMAPAAESNKDRGMAWQPTKPAQARFSTEKNIKVKRALLPEGLGRKSPVLDAKAPIEPPGSEKKRALGTQKTSMSSGKVKEVPTEVKKHVNKEDSVAGAKGAKNGWDEQDIKAALDQHNALRARHGASPLQWSDALAQDAQKAANQCVEKGMLHHSNHAGAGQNGAWGYRSFKDSIDGWYSEISDYDFDHGGFSMGTGHFTQVVWKSCTHIGMARDTTGDGSFIFANYYPPGNFMGHFLAEVQKPQSLAQ